MKALIADLTAQREATQRLWAARPLRGRHAAHRRVAGAHAGPARRDRARSEEEAAQRELARQSRELRERTDLLAESMAKVFADTGEGDGSSSAEPAMLHAPRLPPDLDELTRRSRSLTSSAAPASRMRGSSTSTWPARGWSTWSCAASRSRAATSARRASRAVAHDAGPDAGEPRQPARPPRLAGARRAARLPDDRPRVGRRPWRDVTVRDCRADLCALRHTRLERVVFADCLLTRPTSSRRACARSRWSAAR